MRLSRETLMAEAAATGFRPDMLEKVFYLLDLLEAINRHPFLNGMLALKGGTALNLFLFDLPRLSVDIDLNYIGAEDRETMLAERPRLEEALAALCRRLGLTPQTAPRAEHSGSSWSLRYPSALGGNQNVKVDINYLYRVPLWPPVRLDARAVGSRLRVTDILVLDEYELAAGKLAALLSRRTSRDLFDGHELLLRRGLNPERLRIAFVLYGAMNIEDWRKISIADIDPATQDLESYLLPLLRSDVIQGIHGIQGIQGIGDADDALNTPSGAWGLRLTSECREALSALLPLRDNELAFLNRLLNEGAIEPELFTRDSELCERARRHPALQWKAKNVREFHDRPAQKTH